MSLVGLLSLAILLTLISSPAVADLQSAASVGEVGLVLGEAYRQPQGGKKERLTRGSSITVGDLISTYSNGHVHVRFIDDALVSVRPNSLLSIERYEYDAASPEDSAVRFNLQEGVTRAISGNAAKAARHRFRLNTPVVAIGVRGTDFVVSTSEATTRALVNEGAIVMAPYSDACSADSLGPCIINALELTDSTLQLASMEQDEPLPRLLPPQSVRAPDMMRAELKLAVDNAKNGDEASEIGAVGPPPSDQALQRNPQQDKDNEVLLEGVTTVQVRAEAQVAAETVAATDFIPTDPIAVSVSVEGPVAQFDLTPPKPLTSAALSDRQLVWGRYADSSLSTDRLALSFEEARASRNITVGNFDYGLFRAESSPSRVTANLGLVGFQLTSAQAVFNSATGIASMSVDGGSLDIDFQRSAFTTTLDLSHEQTGQVVFAASGKVADGGFLRAFGKTQRLAGAVSFDGSEAGYLFEKQFGSGTISGLTLWDSK